MKSILKRKRFFQHGAMLTAAMMACTALQANDQDKKQSQRLGQEQHAAKAGQHQAKTPQEFIKHAAQSSMLEIQVGQLAQRQAQNQQLEQLGQALVQDHQRASQRLRQVAQQKDMQLDRQLNQQMQQKLEQLQGKTGEQFDKAFVKHTIKHHMKDIQSFQQASRQFRNEPELTSFIQQTLPVLQKHLEMAQSAAQEVGVDLAAISAEMGQEESAAGAPAGAATGQQEQQQQRQRELDQLDPGERIIIEPEGIPEASIQRETEINREEPDLAANNDNQIIEEDDGEFLGLPTSNNDGTILGLFPAPSREVEAGNQQETYVASELQDGQVSPGVESVREADTDTVAIGGPAGSSSGQAASTSNQGQAGEKVQFSEAPEEVQSALRSQGWNQIQGSLKKLTVYEAQVNGQTVHVTEQGKVYKHGRMNTPQR